MITRKMVASLIVLWTFIGGMAGYGLAGGFNGLTKPTTTPCWQNPNQAGCPPPPVTLTIAWNVNNSLYLHYFGWKNMSVVFYVSNWAGIIREIILPGCTEFPLNGVNEPIGCGATLNASYHLPFLFNVNVTMKAGSHVVYTKLFQVIVGGDPEAICSGTVIQDMSSQYTGISVQRKVSELCIYQ